MSRCAVQHRARALHKEVSQVRITTLADVPKARLAAGGVLARYEPDPGGELPAVLEFPCIAYRRNDRKRGGGADAADLHEALRRLGQACLGFDLPVVAIDAFIEQAQLIKQISDCAARELRHRLSRLRRLATHRF